MSFDLPDAAEALYEPMGMSAMPEPTETSDALT